jgi:hypothetical protein
MISCTAEILKYRPTSTSRHTQQNNNNNNFPGFSTGFFQNCRRFSKAKKGVLNTSFVPNITTVGNKARAMIRYFPYDLTGEEEAVGI